MNKPPAQNEPGMQDRLSSERRAPNASKSKLDDYELKLDDQVGHFLQINHTLTYFMITASVGTFGFTINLLITNKLLISNDPWGVVGITMAALASLLGATASLIALRCDIESYRLHLSYRHKRKAFTDLSIAEQTSWDNLNSLAKWTREASFVLLLLTVLVQFIMIILLFLRKRETSSVPSIFSSFFQ